DGGHRARRRLPPRARRGLLHHRQALGSAALRAAGARAPALLARRPRASRLRPATGPPSRLARGVPPPRPHAPPSRAALAPLLLGRQGAYGARPRPSAPPGRRRREPGRLRPPAPRPGAPRARRPAAGGRDLHGGPGAALPRRDDAALP